MQEEEALVAAVRLNVIDFGGCGCSAFLFAEATERFLGQHARTETQPARAPIPFSPFPGFPARRAFVRRLMLGAATARDEGRAPRVEACAEGHGGIPTPLVGAPPSWVGRGEHDGPPGKEG